jgi:hypothetical protein
LRKQNGNKNKNKKMEIKTETKMQKLVKIFSWLIFFSAGFIFVTCKNPVSLGGAIDASVPVISINKDLGPSPNAFIHGTAGIYISATDDQGVRSVMMTYTYSVPGADGKPVEQPPVTVPARWDKGSGNYVVDIDTKHVKNPYAADPPYIAMADGALLATVIVEDSSGKRTVSSELVYTVKNNPPDISMQIPRPKTKTVETNTMELKNDKGDFPGVVTNNYIMGVFEDLAGVAKGYPRIKFWLDGSPEPGAKDAGTGDKDNAGWNQVTASDSDPYDGWVSIDEGQVTNAKGERGGSFRYYLRERQADGMPYDEDAENKALPAKPGVYYNLKIKVMDINGIYAEWPRDFYNNKPEYMTVELLASGTPPVVTILKPVELYQRADFTIEAKAALAAEDTLNTAIVNFSLEVAGKTKGNPNESKPVILAKWDMQGSDKETPPQEFEIKLGKTYYQLAGESKARGPFNDSVIPDTVEGKSVESYVTFIDGNFNFTARAEGDSGMSGSRLLSLYIDRSPPTVSVTSVSPYFSQDDPSLNSGTDKPNNNIHDKTDVKGNGIPDPYRRWTINSTVKIGVNSTDTRGNAVDPLNNGYMQFKYLLLTDGDITQSGFTAWQNGDSAKSFGEYLYTHPKAVFFDYLKARPLDLHSPLWVGKLNDNPLGAVTGEDGAYTLSFQTHHYQDGNTSASKYLIWFYIVSKDNAGNVNYDKILLNVDDDTDIPVVEFGNLNKEDHPQGLTFADETLNIRLNISDDDGLTASAVEYRFQKDASDNNTWSHGADALSWYPLNAAPSVDGKSIQITDLSLIKIACDLLGHPYDESLTMDAAHRSALGLEVKTKSIEVRVHDNVNKKVYPDTDGKVYGRTGPRKFTMDLTSPFITPSVSDITGAALSPSRTSENPFGAPQKDEAFKTALTAYGDFLERNFQSFSVVIDGGEHIEINRFVVPASIPGADPKTGHAAVWKAISNGASWDGELRWRFSLASTDFKKGGVQVTNGSTIWDNLSDGSHTLMIEFTDKVPRSTVKQVTFFKDSEGPAINFITINGVRLTGSEAAAIKGGGVLSADIKAKYDAIKAGATIQETDAKIIGTFVDGYSAVAPSFWYKIDNGPWLSKQADLTSNSSSKGKTANWTLDVKDLLDGFHTLSVRAKDSGGSGYDDTSVDPPNGPGAETNIGFILDRKDPALIIVSPYGDRDTVDTVYGYKTAGIAPSTKVITIKGLAGDSSLQPDDPVLAAIDGNKASAAYITKQALSWRGSRAADPADPAPVKWDAYHKTGADEYFIYTGSAWDKLGKVPAGSTPYTPAEGEETLLWTFSLDANGLDNAVSTDGSHKITISAEDSTGRKTVKAWNFVRDNTAPVINIVNGAPGNGEDRPVIIMDSAGPKIQGTVSDLHGNVAKLEAMVEKKAAGAWSASAAWEEMTVKNGSWEKPVDSGDGQYRITVRAYDDARTGDAVSGSVQTLAALYFIIDTAPPVLSELPIVPFRNSGFALSGTVLDANPVTISAAMDGAAVSSGITQPDSSGKWAVNIQANAANPAWEKSHTVTITAEDKAGRTDTKVYNFTYDKTAPNVSIAAPAPGTHNPATDAGDLSGGRWAFYDSGVWINGVTDVRGTSDDKNGLTKIYYHLGKLTADTDEVYNAASWTDTLLDTGTPRSGWTGGLYSWIFTDNFNTYGSVPGMIIPGPNTDNSATADVNEDNPNDFYLPLYVKVVDAAGNRRIIHYNLWIDPDLDRPQVVIATPANNSTVGGEVRVSGTASDDDWVYGVQIRIKNGSTYYKNTGDKYIYGDSSTLEEDKKGWVWAYVVGNTSTVIAWYYSINTDGGLNPAMGTMTQVEIEARAVDTQDDLHASPMIIGSAAGITIKFDSNVPTVSNALMSRDNGTTWEALTAGVRAGGTFIIKATVRDEGGVSSIRARETGDPAYRDMLASANPKPGQWTVERPALISQDAWETGWKYFIVDPGSIVNWANIDAEFTTTKIYAMGTTFKYKPGASAPGGTATAYQAKGTRGTISAPSDPDYGKQYDGQYFEYTITVKVDSTAAAYYPYGKTGNYSLELQVTDNNTNPAPYMTAVAYNVMVDNFFPTTVFTTKRNVSTANATISGTAKDYDDDSGNVQGLAWMLVYFQRGAEYMNGLGTINKGMTSRIVKDLAKGAVLDSNGVAVLNNFPVLEKAGKAWKSPHAMVIDSQELGEKTDNDGDGTRGERWEDKGVDKLWQAYFDTAKFTDGPITVHYVLMDMAGNATHYTQDIYIRNNPPIIREFNLGTDLDGNGTIDSWELNGESFVVAVVDTKDPSDARDDTVSIISSMTKAIQTNFTVRNNQLRFDLNTFGGNGQKHYQVSYVTANEKPLDSTALTAGEVYTIGSAKQGGTGNTDWISLGAPNNNPYTTFVATGPAPAYQEDGKTPTTGKAVSYTGVWAKTGDFEADGARPSGYSDRAASLFKGPEDFDKIPDSIVGKTPDLTHERFFIIKVYDTTVSSGAEKQQLAYAVLLNLDTDNKDETPPAANVIPFYWKSLSDNSLYKNSRNNGHIELEADLPGTFNETGGMMDKEDPKVSGQISIRGTASDNGRLDSLWVYLDGFDFNFTGAETIDINSPPGSSRQYVKAAVYSGKGEWAGTDLWGDRGWKFTVNTGAGSDHVHNQTGHRVSWRLDIDTAKIAGVAAADRVFRILAKDGAPNNSAESNTQTKTAAQTPYYRMDVAPYITEVETRLSAFNRSAPSVFARSAQGKYIVADDDDDIIVYGFNLFAKSPPVTAPVITLKDVPVTVTTANLGDGNDPRPSSWQYAKINVGAGSSGPLVVKVNGFSSLNNKNNNDAELNKQPNSANNNTLTDDIAIDIWQFTEVFKSRSESRYPTMKVGPQGQIGFSFANDYQWFNMPGYIYGTTRTDSTAAPAFNGKTGSGFWSQTPYQRAWGGYTHNTFAFDAKGNTYGTAINIDEAGPALAANFSFMNRRPSALPGDMGDQNNYEGTLLNGMRLENTAMPSNPYTQGAYIVDVNRIQSPAIVTSMLYPGSSINNEDNRVNVYMAYYDRTTRQVRFRAGTVGKDFNTASGSDILGTAANALTTAGTVTRQINAPSHGLTDGTQVYLRSGTSTANAYLNVDKTIPYYVRDVIANGFNVALSPGAKAVDISNGNNVPVVISVTGGGLADLSGRIGKRIEHTDAKPSSYQIVAASGEYNTGTSIPYAEYEHVPAFSVTYPNATKYGPGAHVAIGVVKSGARDIVVLAWYDEMRNLLVYSYNDNPGDDSSKDQWQAHAEKIEDNAGEGVSLAVDSDGGIHLSYYSSSGADLKYAYAKRYDGEFTMVMVDAYLAVGTQSTITVGKDAKGRQVPYISYYATGAAALRAKLAYRDYEKVPDGGTTVAGADNWDQFTGAWEISAVPTKRTPTDYRISVGVHTVDGALSPIPKGAKVQGSAYPAGADKSTPQVDPPTRVYGNGTLNPVVGYGTSTKLEMAQKK